MRSCWPAQVHNDPLVVRAFLESSHLGCSPDSLSAPNLGKAKPDPMRDSFMLSHVGYWVDNGAPYYHTGTRAYPASKGMQACVRNSSCTQEDALLAVKTDAKERRIPLRYYQWDDWAQLNWDWPPRAFPDGASHWLGACSWCSWCSYS